MVTPEEYNLLMGVDYSSKPFGSVEIEQPQPTWDEYWRDQTTRHLSAIDPSSDVGDLDRISTMWGNFAPGTLLPGKLKPSDYANILSSGRKSEGVTAAIKDPISGKIYTGGYHPTILDSLQVAADMGQIEKTWVQKLQDHYMHGNAGYGKTEMDKLFGFVDDSGKFFTRHDAEKMWRANEASAVYRRTGYEPPMGFGERPIDNPVNPNPVKKPKKAKGLIPLAAGPGLLDGYEPDYSLLQEGAYDEPVQPQYLLDILKKGAEKFSPSGPDFPVPSESLGIRGQVQGISPTPPAPGRNLLEKHIPGTREWTKTISDRWDTSKMFQRGSIDSPLAGFGVANLRPISGLGDVLAPQMAGMVRQSEQSKYLLDVLKKAEEKFSAPKPVTPVGNIRDRFGASLTKLTDPESRKFIGWVNRMRNQIAIHPNSKTGMSLDFTTSCCARAGGKGACAYCYVEQPRTALNELGMKKYIMQTKRLVETPYQGELRKMPKGLVTELNRDGGLRGQSFSDYIPEKHESMWQAALDDAATLKTPENPDGLFLKIITKKLDMVDRFATHPNARFNISIDYLPKGMSNAPSIEEAFLRKQQHPYNVKIRSVALNEQQLQQQLADPRIDVITLYHGPVGEELYKIVATQNPQLVAQFGEDAVRAELATWKNMGPRGAIHKQAEEQARKMYGVSKICCEGGKCAKDPTKCGFGIAGLGMLIAGVEIPERGE